MPGPSEPLLSLNDIIYAGLIEPFKRLLTPEPRQDDYALWPAGYKEGKDFVADEQAKMDRINAHTEEVLDELEDQALHPETCKVCKGRVEVMCMTGTGICSILCEKVDRGEISMETRMAIREGTTVESGIK